MFGQREEVLNALQARSADLLPAQTKADRASVASSFRRASSDHMALVGIVTRMSQSSRRMRSVAPAHRRAAIRIEIDRLRCEADIALGELVDLPFEGHGGLGRQRAVWASTGLPASRYTVGPAWATA